MAADFGYTALEHSEAVSDVRLQRSCPRFYAALIETVIEPVTADPSNLLEDRPS